MYKLELTTDELAYLIMNLSINDVNQEEFTLGNELRKKLVNAKAYFPSYHKRNATIKATEVRSKKAKDKIENAINLLHLENKDITHYSISKESGVSYNTVKKHIPDLDIIGKF